MTIRIGKHFFNALMVDIFNWGFNIAVLRFIWTVSPYYATLIGCLAVSRFIAEMVFTRQLRKEEMELREAAFEELLKQQGTTKEEFVDNQIQFPFVDKKKTDDDKKVH